MYDVIDLLSRYIQLDTSNPPGNEYLGAAFFKAYLSLKASHLRLMKKKGAGLLSALR
jgi:hypothetical protein